MRERISYIGKRYSKANNKYMTHDDSNEESKFIVYLDANNLYACTMSHGGFKLSSQKKLINLM